MQHNLPVPDQHEDAAEQRRDEKLQVLLARLGIDVFPSHDTRTLSLDHLIVPGASQITPSPRLVKSIRLFGILQPPSVVLHAGQDEIDPDATFAVIFGRRRVLGARLAGRVETKCEVYESATPQLAAILGLIENEQRSAAWIREVQDLRGLIDDRVGMTVDELVAFGFDRTSLTFRLKLAQLPEALYTAVLAGTLSQVAAKKMMRLTSSQLHHLEEMVLSGEPMTEALVTGMLHVQVNAGLHALPLDSGGTTLEGETSQREPWTTNTAAEDAHPPSTLPSIIALLQGFERGLLPGAATHTVRLLTKALLQELEVASRSTSPLLTTQTPEEVCYG